MPAWRWRESSVDRFHRILKTSPNSAGNQHGEPYGDDHTEPHMIRPTAVLARFKMFGFRF
jgi:hypothetical protein